MSRVPASLRAVWEFVVGDDWRTALGVLLALAVTALLAAVGIAAWWVMPAAVLGLLALSVRRAGASRHGDSNRDPNIGHGRSRLPHGPLH